MSDFTKDKVNFQSSIRFFYQLNGAAPDHRMYFGGMDGQYINIESASSPLRNIDGSFVHDPSRAGSFEMVGLNRSAPEIASATVQFLQKKGNAPVQSLYFRQGSHNFYAVAGEEGADVSDYDNGVSEWVQVFSGGQMTSPTENLGSWDGGEKITDEAEFKFRAIYKAFPFAFDAKGAAQITTEAVDVVWGKLGNGLDIVYTIQNNGASAPTLQYHKKSGNGTWSSTDVAITGADTSDTVEGLAIVGDKIVVIYDDTSQGGYFYATLNEKTGVPSAFTQVATGFVTSKAPKGIYAPSGRQVFIVGEGGYIYKSHSLSAGVSVVDAGELTTEDLTRITGCGSTLLAVGGSGAFLISRDMGNSWEAIASSPSGSALTAVAAATSDTFYAAAGSSVYFSTDEGNTWTTQVIDSTIATVQDIVFPTPEVGYLLAATSAPAALLYTTMNGGLTWAQAGSFRLESVPTADRFNRLAFPKEVNDPYYMVNHIALAGLAGDGSDGIVTVGAPKTF